MKISHLQEGTVAGDPGITQNSQQAPRFGRDPTTLEQVANLPNIGFKSARDPKVLEKKVDETTVAGNFGGGAPTNMGMQRRGSIFSGIKTSSKYPNSKKAGIYEDEISEEQLKAKQRQEELFKKAIAKDILDKHKTRISDILLKRDLEKSMMEEMDMMEEDDNDFWYHGPHSIAEELHRIHNKPTITIEDIHQLWEGYPPTHISVINNKPFMEKPDVAGILKAHKELIENGKLI